MGEPAVPVGALSQRSLTALSHRTRSAHSRMTSAARAASAGVVFHDETLMRIRRSVPGYAVTSPRDKNLIPPGLQPRLPFEQVF